MTDPAPARTDARSIASDRTVRLFIKSYTENSLLCFNFYTVEGDTVVLFDSLRVYKTN